MAQELSLGEAVRALTAEYGESFSAGFEDGKEMMALTLLDRLQLSKADATATVESLIQAHSIRWAGDPAQLAYQENGMFSVPVQRVQKGTWYLT